MPILKRLPGNTICLRHILLPLLLCKCFLFLFCYSGSAQSCPPNIDFETGTFDGWNCYVGFAKYMGGQNVLDLVRTPPLAGHHTMYSTNANAGQVDAYGGFPVNCPNGSGYSIKLGNTEAGGIAEGVSYEFTIPANRDSFSLVYNYAVVFQSPHHAAPQQPRLQIEITNVTDNRILNCASVTFIAEGTAMPGFMVSSLPDSTTVLYKNWSAVTVDLSGNAGKTIRLFFKTGDCTFSEHFGYAYIDVNSECSSSGIIGATYCPNDTVVHVTAPYGYQSYTWYNSSLTTVLGNQQTLRFSPPPPSSTVVAVKLEPHDGYGCPKTLFATLKDTLGVTADAGKDTVSCNGSPVQIGMVSRSNLNFIWSPTAGLSNPNVANPIARPTGVTTYVLTIGSIGGGCRSTDSVLVKTSYLDTSLQLLGKDFFCKGYGDSAVLVVNPINSVQWYRNELRVNQAVQARFNVQQSGTYYALLRNADGCKIATRKQPVLIDTAKQGIRYPDKYALTNVPQLLQARNIGTSAIWSPGVFLDNPYVFMPIFKGTADQLYTVTIRSSAGCLTIDTQLVRKIEKVNIWVPSAFTPNKDGRNDVLRPTIIGLKELHFFRIYNRWGQLLFETKNASVGWGGWSKGMELLTQTVIWVLEGEGLDGKIYTQKGTAVLIR